MNPTEIAMPRYYFHLRNGLRFDDVDGLELRDFETARAEAVGLARDLMRLDASRRDWLGSSVCVTDAAHNVVLEMAFLDAV